MRRNRSQSLLAQPEFIRKPPEKLVFSEVATDVVITSLTTEERRRQELVYDLLNQERQYVRDLTVYNELFLKPITVSKVLTRQDVQSTFASFSEITTVSKALLDVYESRQKSEIVIKKIGDIFTNQEQSFKLYTAYATNFPPIQAQIQQLTEKNVQLNEFLQKTFSRTELSWNGKGFLQYLSLPIERLKTYPKTFQGLLECTPPEHGDHHNIQQSLEMINSFVLVTNQAFLHATSVQKLTEIQKKLAPNHELRLVLPTRTFLRQGVVTSMSKQTRKLMTCDMILCNDLILFVKKGKNKIASNISTSVKLLDIIDEHGSSTNSFELIWEGDDLIISLATQEERNEWITAIDQGYTLLDKDEKMQRVLMTDRLKTPSTKVRTKMSKIFKKQEESTPGTSPSDSQEVFHPRVASQIDFLTRKITSTRETAEILKKEISNATEKKRKLERELEALHANDNNIQQEKRLDLQLTLASAETMTSRYLSKQLDKVKRETTIVQKDLERNKKKTGEDPASCPSSPSIPLTSPSPSSATLTPSAQTPSPAAAARSKEEEKNLTKKLALEQEKGKFLESEKNRMVEDSKKSIEKLQKVYEEQAANRQKASEKVAQVRISLQLELARRKALIHKNSVLSARLALYKNFISGLPPATLATLHQNALALCEHISNQPQLKQEHLSPPLSLHTTSSAPSTLESVSTPVPSLTSSPSSLAHEGALTGEDTPIGLVPGPSAWPSKMKGTTTDKRTDTSPAVSPLQARFENFPPRSLDMEIPQRNKENDHINNSPVFSDSNNQSVSESANMALVTEESKQARAPMSVEQRRLAMGMLRAPKVGQNRGSLPKFTPPANPHPLQSSSLIP